jgi:hypothetical protein
VTNEYTRNIIIAARVSGHGSNFSHQKIGGKNMIRLANATMHDQSAYRSDFEKLGFDVEPTPRLRQVSGAKEAYELAREVVEQAKKEGYEGLLLGGRTDVMVYIAIQAPAWGLSLYVAETERIRDANDRFVFNLKNVTRVYVSHPADLAGAAIVAEVDTLGMKREVR